MALKDRLSPYNIEDDLLRTELYREIRAGGEDWKNREISMDEVLMPELTAHRFYGTDKLKWVVMVAAGLEDMREAMEAGSVIRLPSIVWVRQRIRYWMEQEKKLKARR